MKSFANGNGSDACIPSNSDPRRPVKSQQDAGFEIRPATGFDGMEPRLVW